MGLLLLILCGPLGLLLTPLWKLAETWLALVSLALWLLVVALAEAYLGGHGVLRDPRESARWAEAARRESTS